VENAGGDERNGETGGGYHLITRTKKKTVPSKRRKRNKNSEVEKGKEE